MKGTAAPMSLQPMTDSTPLLHEADSLRERARAEGYLLFHRLLPREQVLALRRQFVDILARHGWLRPDTDPMQAIAGRAKIAEGEEMYRPVFDDFQRLELFHSLPHSPALMAVVHAVLGEPALVHPRHIGRVLFPDSPPTPPHQDYVHVRGTRETWTAWVPLGDLGSELGGLAVTPRSHQHGVLPTQPMPGAGGVGIPAEHLTPPLRTTTYEAGDVLLIHSLTPHQSLPNQTVDRMRLSMDCRYQAVSQPVSRKSLRPHLGYFNWPFVYSGWSSERYQYYWRDLPLTIAEDE